jgi:hypothetical protein
MDHDYYLCVGQGKKENFFHFPPNWVATLFLESETGEILSFRPDSMATDAIALAGHPALRVSKNSSLPAKGNKIRGNTRIVGRHAPRHPGSGHTQSNHPALAPRTRYGRGFSRENIAIVIALGTHGA